MRRFLLVLIFSIVGLSVVGDAVEAKRRIVVVPTGSSNSCVERDDEGTCIRRRRDVERERRASEGERASANQYSRSTNSDYSGGGLSYIYYIIAALIMFGGGLFKLFRRGVGVAVSAAGSMARSATESSSSQTSDWANRAARQFGPIVEPQPAAAAAAPLAAAPRQPSMSPMSSRSGSGSVTAKPVRASAGFGRTSAPPAAEAPVPEVAPQPAPAPQPARAAAVATPAPRQATFAAGAASPGRRPRGSIQPRTTFGMKR